MKALGVKCYFCTFIGSLLHFRFMFNGRPVCLRCADKRRAMGLVKI
jgi:hypothetical protein